jgi:hypothetical protein
MVAIAVASENLASPIAVTAQEGVHLLLQHRRQHLPGSFPDVGFQGILDLVLLLLALMFLV